MKLLLFCTIAILFALGLQCCECQPQPHRTCDYRLYRSLDCTETNLTIPDNFDVNSVPHYFRILRLDCPGSSASVQCNVLRDQCEPIPRIQTLNDVTLRGLRAEDETQRPPVDRFLADNKHQITSLSITNSKLHYLDQELFRGFRVLEHLAVVRCGIHSIALDTFQALTLPIQSLTEGTVYPTPMLGGLNLYGNALEQFDWSILEPVKGSLKRFGMDSQKPSLKRIFRSGPDFNFTSLWLLDISDNALTGIPAEILQSLIPGHQPYKVYYRFHGSNFCNKTDCSCCDMVNFVQWVRNLSGGRGSNLIAFSCGVAVKVSINRDDFRIADIEDIMDIYANASINLEDVDIETIEDIMRLYPNLSVDRGEFDINMDIYANCK